MKISSSKSRGEKAEFKRSSQSPFQPKKRQIQRLVHRLDLLNPRSAKQHLLLDSMVSLPKPLRRVKKQKSKKGPLQ
jgi:hypothetical protein